MVIMIITNWRIPTANKKRYILLDTYLKHFSITTLYRMEYKDNWRFTDFPMGINEIVRATLKLLLKLHKEVSEYKL